MSLESVIERLAIATENNAAVREIMRQRDEANNRAAQIQRDFDFCKERKDSYYAYWKAEERRVAALRGVVTRMKQRNQKPQEGK